MNRKIRNWTDATELTVKIMPASETLPAIALIEADSGPLRLHFGMNADQARDMARALMTAAAEIEAAEVPA